MNIDIPSNVQFRVRGVASKWDNSEDRPVCFRHAVLRAFKKDAHILTELNSRYSVGCDDCSDEIPEL